MNSPRTGEKVANQYIIDDGENTFFQSYETIIAMYPNYDDTKITLDKDSWDYSVTTLKYLKEFLAVTISKKEIEKKIKTGEYKLDNLN